MTLEKTIQNDIIQVFKKMGYEYLGSNIKLLGNSPKLDDNFRKQMERLNKDVLEGLPLSDSEFERLRNTYPKNHSTVFETLRNGVSIVLDNNRRVSLKFIDKLHANNNVFQITDELKIVGVKESRLDVVVLINGIPIADIEMKQPGKSKGIEEAITQINRYNNNGIYKQDLLNFIQLFAATNGVATKYFSVDPRTERGEGKYGEFAFNWMDKNNRFVSRLVDFIHEFFEPEHFIRVLFHYMLMKPLPNEQIMVMRPYQIHAVHSILSTVSKGLGFNTYISASTGSGKTLTSFKTAELLASEGHKVIMLLDRNDLAEQTTREFKQFDANGLIKDLVKGTELHKALIDDNEKLVITTIQSFNKWIIRKDNIKHSKALADSGEVVILVDECHRSTSATMFANVKRAFFDKQYNILKCHLVGFTGTPLLEENVLHKQQMTQITFGEVAHIYTITEAIRDKSVLPFKLFTVNVESGLDRKELSKYSKTEYFGNPARIQANASEIVEQFKNHTLQIDQVKDSMKTDQFVAMLAADNKASAVAYWELFREAFKKEKRKTAIVFSLEDNKEWANSFIMEQEKYEEILNAYDEDFGTSFVEVFKNDIYLGRDAHTRDVVERSKKGEIDMLVVSDMLLTGYDNKYVNTIYLDKNLKTHGLLQAASRTNRLFGERKRFGNVVLFSDRDMKDAFKDSIMLFGTAINIEEVINFDSFRDVRKKLLNNVFLLRNIVSSPEEVDKIDAIDDLKQVVEAYRGVSQLLNDIRIYPEWDEGTGYKDVGITRDDMDMFYAHIELAKERLFVKDPSEEELKNDPDFVVSTVDGQVVGYEYILKLLNNFVASPPAERDRWLRWCEDILSKATDPEILQNKSAVERVLDAARNDEIQTVDDLFERLDYELKREREINFMNFAEDMKIPYILVEEMVDYHKNQNKSMSKLALIKFLRDFRDEYLRLGKSIDQPALLANDEVSLRKFAEKLHNGFDELFV